MPRIADFVEQLAHDEVNLTEVRLVGVRRHAGAVLDCGALVGVAVDAQPGYQLDRFASDL